MPYRFLDSKKYKQQLISTLENIGYEFKNEEKGYREQTIKFNLIWDTSCVLLIKWEREFVSDGLDEQDSRIVLSIDNTEIGMIDIEQLLSSKLETSLNEEVYIKIIEKVKAHNIKGG